MTNNDADTSYAARKPCGCIAAAISCDRPAAEVADAVADWIRAGYTVEHVGDDVVRERFTGLHCVHDAKQEQLL